MPTIIDSAVAEVNERTTGYLNVSFVDKTGAAVAPSSVRYRVDCRTTGQQVLDWQNVATGSQVEIELDASVLDIITASNPLEVKEITVEGAYGANDEVHRSFTVVVRNLRFL